MKYQHCTCWPSSDCTFLCMSSVILKTVLYNLEWHIFAASCRWQANIVNCVTSLPVTTCVRGMNTWENVCLRGIVLFCVLYLSCNRLSITRGTLSAKMMTDLLHGERRSRRRAEAFYLLDLLSFAPNLIRKFFGYEEISCNNTTMSVWIQTKFDCSEYMQPDVDRV